MRFSYLVLPILWAIAFVAGINYLQTDPLREVRMSTPIVDNTRA